MKLEDRNALARYRIALFNKHFVNENSLPKEFYKLIMKAKILRKAADYADFTQIQRAIAEEYLANAEVSLRQVEEVLRKFMIERTGT